MSPSVDGAEEDNSDEEMVNIAASSSENGDDNEGREQGEKQHATSSVISDDNNDDDDKVSDAVSSGPLLRLNFKISSVLMTSRIRTSLFHLYVLFVQFSVLILSVLCCPM